MLPLDLVLILDVSTSVTFNLTLQLARTLVSRLNISRDDVRVAVVAYSSSATVRFFLDTYSSQSTVLDALGAIKTTGL